MAKYVVIPFRATPGTREEIIALARVRGVSVSAFIRKIFELDLDTIKVFVDAAEAHSNHGNR